MPAQRRQQKDAKAISETVIRLTQGIDAAGRNTELRCSPCHQGFQTPPQGGPPEDGHQRPALSQIPSADTTNLWRPSCCIMCHPSAWGRLKSPIRVRVCYYSSCLWSSRRRKVPCNGQPSKRSFAQLMMRFVLQTPPSMSVCTRVLSRAVVQTS